MTCSARLAGIGDKSELVRSSTLSFSMRTSLPCAVGEDEHLAFLSKQKSGETLAVLGGDRRRAEELIDVAIGIERVFQQPIDPAQADAVKLRADARSFSLELMAIGAVLDEDFHAVRRVELRARGHICLLAFL